MSFLCIPMSGLGAGFASNTSQPEWSGDVVVATRSQIAAVIDPPANLAYAGHLREWAKANEVRIRWLVITDQHRSTTAAQQQTMADVALCLQPVCLNAAQPGMRTLQLGEQICLGHGCGIVEQGARGHVLRFGQHVFGEHAASIPGPNRAYTI